MELLYILKYLLIGWQYIIGLFIVYKLLSVLLLYFKNEQNKIPFKELDEATPDEGITNSM